MISDQFKAADDCVLLLSSLTLSHHKVMLRLEMLPTLDFDTSELDTLRLCFLFLFVTDTAVELVFKRCNEL